MAFNSDNKSQQTIYIKKINNKKPKNDKVLVENLIEDMRELVSTNKDKYKQKVNC